MSELLFKLIEKDEKGTLLILPLACLPCDAVAKGYKAQENYVLLPLLRGARGVFLTFIPVNLFQDGTIGLNGTDGEKKFMPIIDLSNPKQTAFLPYEILVMNGEVHMLHGRYRIALSFPDLTMGTFTKIMSTPGDIEDLLR